MTRLPPLERRTSTISQNLAALLNGVIELFAAFGQELGKARSKRPGHSPSARAEARKR